MLFWSDLLLIINKFYTKEKMLENDLAKQKLSSKPAKAAVRKTLNQNWQNIPRSSQQNDKSEIAKPPFYLHWDFRIFLTFSSLKYRVWWTWFFFPSLNLIFLLTVAWAIQVWNKIYFQSFKLNISNFWMAMIKCR